MSAALTFGFAVPFALILLVLLVVVVLVDRRDDLDPGGRRPFAAYVFVVVFLTLFTTLFALAAMVGSLVHLATSDDDTKESQNTPSAETFTAQGPSGPIVSDPSRDTTLTDADDAHIRDAVRAGLLAAAAGGVLFFHLGMARTAAEDSVARAAPARRADRSSVCVAMTTNIDGRSSAAGNRRDRYRHSCGLVRGRPGLRISPALLGSRPASASARRSRNSI